MVSVQHSEWRQSRWLIISELIVVALIFLADARHLIPFSKTPFLFVFAWISLRVRRVTWQSIGLTRYKSWGATVATGLLAGLILEAFQLFVSQPFLIHVLHKYPTSKTSVT